MPATFQKIIIRENFVAEAMTLNGVPAKSVAKIPEKTHSPASELLNRSRSIFSDYGGTRAAASVWKIVFLAWFTGVTALFIRLIYGLGYQQACCRRARPLGMGVHVNVIQSAEKILGTSLPPIFVSHPVDLPLAAGWFRPRVLLPEGLPERINGRQLESILLHECAHIVRGDQWVGLVQRTVAMMFWFHPFVHMLNRQIGRAREEVCDNYALHKGDGDEYARTLLQLAEHMADWLPENSAVVKCPVFRSYEAVIPISIRDGQTVMMSGVKPEVEHDKNFLVFVTAGRVEAAQNHR